MSSSATIFSSSVLPMPGSSVTVPSRVMRGDRARRLADRLGRVAVGEDAVHDRAVELVEVGQLVEERGDRGVRRVGHRRPTRVRALRCPDPLAHPADLQRGREHRAIVVTAARRVLAAAAPDGLPDPGRRRRLARRHGRDRRPPRRRARRRRGAAPHGPRGPRARPTWPGFARALDGGAGYVFEMDADFSHDPDDLARLLAAVRDGGADLALGSRYVPGGGVERLGARPRGHQPRRLLVRAARARPRAARPHRRLQVLPRARCCAAIDLPTRALAGLRVPGRADLPRVVRGLPRRRGADRLPRPRARARRRCRGGSRVEAMRLVPQLRTGRQAPGR